MQNVKLPSFQIKADSIVFKTTLKLNFSQKEENETLKMKQMEMIKSSVQNRNRNLKINKNCYKSLLF